MLNDFIRSIPERVELIDSPIIFNIKASKKGLTHSDNNVLPDKQYYHIEHLEIKGIKRKETLFNSKECVLDIYIGIKWYGPYTLQLFHWNKRKESYVYDLGVPLVILPMQQHSISINGIDGNLIVILHGKRARPLQ